ncbi:MAG: hypothetical protein ACLFVE_00020 [Chitinispirillaceae bacterium]
MYQSSDRKSVEKYSSAVTLSDMEVFIFPELMYSLFLANIMSPRLWRWKEDSWFSKLGKMNAQKRIQRLKQYIMDHFSFNLDLDTWGLTTKEKELSRFSDIINEKILAESNALFGYEGDKYYFDIDIRRHFGLDKYSSNVIPYWKTETLEAMEAFRFREGYPQGAGECVSLAALYASAAFAVAEVPLEDIFMMATPLHSQNFLDIAKGVITNNRRIVTKNMWFNGTELSAKARRALENERVTVVTHNTGYIHTLYENATIDPDHYQRFRNRLSDYLRTEITYELLANFLRQKSRLQRCFQLAHLCCGKPRYIEAEKVYSYEHSSKYRVGDKTQSHLLHDIEEDEYYTEPHPDRIILSELEEFLKSNRVHFSQTNSLENLKSQLRHSCFNAEEVIRDLIEFCRITPRLPDENQKHFQTTSSINLEGVQSAQDAISVLEKSRDNETVDLAFMAYRDLSRCPWKPFLKAAFERNPVSLQESAELSIEQCYNLLKNSNGESIYAEPTRMAQPDEVWNFSRGDGLEKAICLASLYKNRNPDEKIELETDRKKAKITLGEKEFVFPTTKQLDSPSEENWQF